MVVCVWGVELPGVWTILSTIVRMNSSVTSGCWLGGLWRVVGGGGEEVLVGWMAGNVEISGCAPPALFSFYA